MMHIIGVISLGFGIWITWFFIEETPFFWGGIRLWIQRVYQKWLQHVLWAGLFSSVSLLMGWGVNSLLFGLMGFSIPMVYQWDRKLKTQKEISTEFPNFLDLLALGLSSGQTLPEAWNEAIGYLPGGELKSRLQQVENERALGMDRPAACRRVFHNVTTPSVEGVLHLIFHAWDTGSPMKDLLFSEADNLREDISLALERRAQTAKVRMLFPIVFLIFPAIFIVLFGSLVLQYLETGWFF